jgi:soluble lytic murein transglycosylase
MSFSLCYADNLKKNHYEQARYLIRQGLYNEALIELDKISEDYVLYDYVLLDRAYCFSTIGNNKEAKNILDIVIKRYRETPTFRKALKNKISFAEEKQEKLESIEAYLNFFPNDYDVLLKKAQLLEELQRDDEAKNIYKSIFLKGNGYAVKVFKKIENNLTIDEIYQTLIKLLKNNYENVESILNKLPANDARTSYLYGVYYFKSKDYEKAQRYLEKLNFEDSFKLYLLSLLRSGRYEEYFKRLEQEMSKKRSISYELVYAGAERKRREGNYELALRYFDFLLQNYPQNNQSTLFGLAWMNIRRGNLDKAKEILETLIKDEHISLKDKYYFWLGKISEYKNEDGSEYYKALKEKEGFYYLRKWPYEGLGKVSNNIKTFKGKVLNIIERIEELKSLNMNDEALTEARYYHEILSETPDYLAKLFYELGDYNQLVKLGIKKGIDFYKYPLAYTDVVFNTSKAFGIDPFLVIAIMREESHFNPNIVSSAGAYGLMQLMPVTAKKVGNVTKVNELFDEEKNIYIGIKYLSDLKKKYSRIEYIIAAYNAGEKAVDLWLQNNYRDADEFIEDIPYNETRDYVKKVLRTYYILRSLYKDKNDKTEANL